MQNLRTEKLWEKWLFGKWKKIKQEIERIERSACCVGRKNEAALNGQYLLKQVLAIRIKYLF